MSNTSEARRRRAGASFRFQDTCDEHEKVLAEIGYGGVLFVGHFGIPDADFEALIEWYRDKRNKSAESAKGEGE